VKERLLGLEEGGIRKGERRKEERAHSRLLSRGYHYFFLKNNVKVTIMFMLGDLHHVYLYI
jgi:hypothetical protein